MCPHAVSTNLIFSSNTFPDWTVLDYQHDWWTLCKCSGGTLAMYGPYKCGMRTRANCRDREFSVNTCDWPERVPCLLKRMDRWRQWEEGKQAAASALCCGWRMEACPQLSDSIMTLGLAADAVGWAAVLSWHQVRLCTVALDTAVAKAGKQHPRNVAGHIICWHLVSIRHIHTESIALLKSASSQHTSVTHCSTRQCPLLWGGDMSACSKTTAVKETQATSSQH